MPKVFISYRRADGQAAADRLYTALAAAVGKDNVFKDVDSIRLSQDFRAAIEKAIILSDVLLVVIGPHWLTVTDDSGQRRLDNSADYVRLEVEIGMRHVRAVIPVLVDGAQMPAGDQLPPSLYQLSYLNGAVLRGEPNTTSDISRLVDQIRGLFDSPAADADAPQPTGATTDATLAISTVEPPASGVGVSHLSVGGHEITIDLAGVSLTKPQRVWFDGALVSERYTVFGVRHAFAVSEKDVQVSYEVQTGSRWHGASYWIVVRRDGVVVYSNK
ncbi:MAG: toll/interleukin-1 receptor domain-containing protein [Chloroflexi bacterium]|nr:toll/interleukin-1 receptor domain-containing protein [Chloroflexota bacterium]